MNVNICGINIPKKKNILYGITKIYGIGIKLSRKICKKLNLDLNKNFFLLNEKELISLREFIRNLVIENDLKIFIKENLKRIINLNNYKSLRHIKKLPCRGQRTKTNAKTRKKMIHEKI